LILIHSEIEGAPQSGNDEGIGKGKKDRRAVRRLNVFCGIKGERLTSRRRREKDEERGGVLPDFFYFHH